MGTGQSLERIMRGRSLCLHLFKITAAPPQEERHDATYGKKADCEKRGKGEVARWLAGHESSQTIQN